MYLTGLYYLAANDGSADVYLPKSSHLYLLHRHRFSALQLLAPLGEKYDKYVFDYGNMKPLKVLYGLKKIQSECTLR